MCNKKFVSLWGNAMSVADRRPENYAKDLTLRYPIYPAFSGDKIKITLDNFCGTEPVTISQIVIATTKEDQIREIVEKTVKPITFGGQSSVTLLPGEEKTSDEMVFQVESGKSISVSLYLGDFTQMRSAVLITGPLSKGFYAVGNYANREVLPMEYTRNTNWFYFLSNIEVYTEAENRAIVCYGDSITSQAWPDYLTLRTKKEGYHQVAIIRKAASGTRILRQYDNITYDSYGIKGSVRFPREAKVTGADTIIIQHGINDIIHPVGVEVNPFRPWSDLPTAREMIEGLQAYIATAREYGLKVYLGTLLPIAGWRTYEPFRNDLRNEVNEWIRHTREADGCIDFDQALCDRNKPEAFAETYDSGDHLHPSEAGYRKMAQSIPIEIL